MKGQHRGKGSSGPLAPFRAGLSSELTSRGYSTSAAEARLWQFDQMGRWMEREGLNPQNLTSEQAERFLAARHEAGYRTWLSARSATVLLDYLRGIGVVPAPASTVVQDGLQGILAAYRGYLVKERGLGRSTIDHYERSARLFLVAQSQAAALDLSRLGPADITKFVARECRARNVASAKNLVAALRSLLRYMHVTGLIKGPLASVVPSVAGRQGSTLPRGLDARHVDRLLASCDQSRDIGRRDFAILTIFSRMGLRAGEVAALQLDDIDWRSGEIMIRGKGDRWERLPLPDDVGQALAQYVLFGRPRREGGALFLKVIAPRGALASGGVRAVLTYACDRTGLPRVGSHRLRHTAATEMLRHGASLVEVAEVLRHRRLQTTAIYAKVDRIGLRTLAPVWPGQMA